MLVLATSWHLRAVLRGYPQPGRLARIGFAAIVTTGVLLSFRTLNGLSAGATLLVAMTAAKLFEARSSARLVRDQRRDACSCCWPPVWIGSSSGACRCTRCASG